MRVAITGNIGSGKSTVAKMLHEKLADYEFYSIDDAARAMYDKPDVQEKLMAKFGVYTRKEISDLVFADPTKRIWLENFSKGVVGGELMEKLAYPNIIVEFPLLFEMRSQERFDYVINCYCDDTAQAQRVKARDAMGDSKLNLIRAAQFSAELKMAMADDTINTMCTMEELEEEVRQQAHGIELQEFKYSFVNEFGTNYREQAKEIYEEVIQNYRQSDRWYHNENHIRAMGREFVKHRAKFNHPIAAVLFILFHDAVYNTRRTEYPHNEMESVKYMRKVLSKHRGTKFTIEDLELEMVVGEYILATKGHVLKTSLVQTNGKLVDDLKLLLDIDLAAFTLPWDQMNKIDDSVWHEFGKFYYQDEFAKGRVDVMKTFLNRDKIFLSDTYAEHEKQARSNMVEIIAKWSKHVHDWDGNRFVRSDYSRSRMDDRTGMSYFR